MTAMTGSGKTADAGVLVSNERQQHMFKHLLVIALAAGSLSTVAGCKRGEEWFPQPDVTVDPSSIVIPNFDKR